MTTEEITTAIKLLQYKKNFTRDRTELNRINTEIQQLTLKLAEAEANKKANAETTADTKADIIVSENIISDTDTNEEEIEEEENFINWNEDIFLPTAEEIRNNNIEEKGRGRNRNKNDVFNNVSISLAIGKVGNNMTNAEYNKILYEKDIEKGLEQLRAEGIKVPSKSRIIKDLTQINKQLGANYVNIVNTNEGLCYQISQSKEGKYFTVVPLYKLKKLLTCTNKQMLRLFVSISMHKDISTENSVLMTRSYLCKCMDIEPTETNVRYISTLTTALMQLGVIDIEEETIIQYIEGERVPKTYNYFRLTTYEEYKEKEKKKKRRRK